MNWWSISAASDKWRTATDKWHINWVFVRRLLTWNFKQNLIGDDGVDGAVVAVDRLILVLSNNSLIMLPSGFSGWNGGPFASRLLAMDSNWATLAVAPWCLLKLLMSTSLTDWAPADEIFIYSIWFMSKDYKF